MAGLYSTSVCHNLYANGNSAYGIFLANGTQGLKRQVGSITRPLTRQWNRLYRMGGHELHDTMISKGTSAWSKSNKLYQSVPVTLCGPIICL